MGNNDKLVNTDIFGTKSTSKTNEEKNSLDAVGKRKKVKASDIKIKNMDNILGSNLIFNSKNSPWTSRYSRFGNFNPTDTYSSNRELILFTKPDLFIYGDEGDTSIEYRSAKLRTELQSNPKFVDWNNRNKNALTQLQYSVTDDEGTKNPFLYLLSNGVTSKMDIPAISSESRESTTNIYGTSIQYRGHSLKSDNGYDFTLSFVDTAYLEIYFFAKAYDEYMRLLQLGEISPKKSHIVNRILPELFSVYKFILSDDGETIIYYAKATGVYLADVPRSDFTDPSQDGFKFSLSFHAQFIEDNDPSILADFNSISPGVINDGKDLVPTYETTRDNGTHIMRVNNEWVKYPVIIRTNPRVSKSGAEYDYRLRWTNNNAKKN